MEAFRKPLESARNFHLPIISISLIILTILVVYWQDLSILFNEALHSEAVSHIIFIPFLVSYLIYRKKELVKASLALENFREKTILTSVGEIIGIAFCLTAFLLYWYGSYTFYPLEYHIVSLIIFIMGVTLILTNAKALVILIFPIMFLAFLLPPPSNIIYTVGGFLANVNTQGSYSLLKFAGLPVSLSYKLGAPVIALNISPKPMEFAVYQASSGIYSLLAFTTFAIFLVYITRGSIIKKVALFACGLLILPILNIIRISIIVSVAYGLGLEMAEIFHTFSGWLLIFCGILLLLFIGEKFLHLQLFGGSKEISSCSECNDSLKKREPFCFSCGKFLKTPHVRISKSFWIKVTALLIGSYLVTVSIQAPAFAFAPGLVSNHTVNASWSTLKSGYAISFNFHGTDIFPGTYVTVTAGTLDSSTLQVTFRWLRPNATVAREVMMPVFTNGTTEQWNNGTTALIRYAMDFYTPDVGGEWEIQAFFQDSTGRHRAKLEDVIKIRADPLKTDDEKVYRLQFLYRDVNYERVAGQDASLMYAYLPPPDSSASRVYVIMGVATSISNLHNWEVSLIAWQISRGLPPLASLIESEDVQLTENPRIIARYLVFQHPSNYTYVAIYWYQKALFRTGLTVESRYIRINLLILTKNSNDYSKLKEELMTMGQDIEDSWEPLRVQSLVSVGIPLQQFLLGSTVVAAIFVQTSQYALKERKKRTSLKIFEKLASSKEKLLYQIIKELSQKTKETTTQNIASAFEKATGEPPVKLKELIHMLKNLEKHEIINADIINILNQPRLVWRP